MSKELREAAQRVIRQVNGSVSAYVFTDDVINVCRAYLAEHRADDDELVSVEWLKKIGLTNQWYDDCWGTNQYGIGIGVGICVPSGGVMISTGGVITAPDGLTCFTRGDVRRLARGLKIDLGE